MRVRRLLLSFVVAIMPAAVAWADEVPFGLHWGDQLDYLSTKEVIGQVQKDDGKSLLVVARNLRPLPAETDSVLMVVHRQLGLQRIVWLSKDIDNDPAGARGIALFQQIKAKLTEIYGRPRFLSEEMLDTGHFYRCLSSDGCGSYAARWRTDDGGVVMQLAASKDGELGRIETVYEGPAWQEVVADRDRKPKEPVGPVKP